MVTWSCGLYEHVAKVYAFFPLWSLKLSLGKYLTYDWASGKHTFLIVIRGWMHMDWRSVCSAIMQEDSDMCFVGYTIDLF
jgi:hypothetical protein